MTGELCISKNVGDIMFTTTIQIFEKYVSVNSTVPKNVGKNKMRANCAITISTVGTHFILSHIFRRCSTLNVERGLDILTPRHVNILHTKYTVIFMITI